MNNPHNFSSKRDLTFFVVVITLATIGIINLYSATLNDPHQAVRELWKSQLLYGCVGICFSVLISFINYELFVRAAYYLYALMLGLLITVDIVGHASMGGQRWINLGFMRFQPSEVAKLFLVFTLARYFSDRGKYDGFLIRHLFAPTLLVAVPALLTIAQPDLGTGLLMVGIYTAIVLLMRIRLKSVLIALGIVVVCLGPIYQFGLKPYQKKRIEVFIDPFKDPRGAGYNSIQSIIAVGSGGIFGKGYTKGTQTQLHYLPEQHTDFAYPVFAEEHGFLGSVLLISLYFVLIFRGLKVAAEAKDPQGSIIAVGITAILFWHVFINIGMTTGILPIVGIPLPFLSYGGSSLMTFLICYGILTNISNRRFIFNEI